MNSKDLSKINDYAWFYNEQRGLDTVCFVHGLRGHPETTWGKFPELLTTDPNLPELDILLWGYKTAALRHGAHDPEKLGSLWMGSLTAQIDESNVVHAVGHSMGGLVILNGLLGEMKSMRAQKHPCQCVSFITLYASPVTGSMASAIIKYTFGGFFWMNKQLRGLAKGTVVETLLKESHKRIYAPKVQDSGARYVPIRMVVALGDRAVSESDRKGPTAWFDEFTPCALNFGHSDIKLPESHKDDRYKILRKDLLRGLAERFQQICTQCLDSDAAIRTEGEIAFQQRYERLIRSTYIEAGGRPRRAPENYKRYRQAIWRDSISCGRPPHDTAHRAVAQLQIDGWLPQ